MGDSAETMYAAGAFNRQETQERHAEWFRQNMAVLDASGLRFIRRETSMLFRETGKPKVDFYPHTGRWRVVGAGKAKTQGGGAEKFLGWYRAQRTP